MSTNQPRKPKGTPQGGQFDHSAGGGISASLDDSAGLPVADENNSQPDWEAPVLQDQRRLGIYSAVQAGLLSKNQAQDNLENIVDSYANRFDVDRDKAIEDLGIPAVKIIRRRFDEDCELARNGADIGYDDPEHQANFERKWNEGDESENVEWEFPDSLGEAAKSFEREGLSFKATGGDWAANPDGSQIFDWTDGTREEVSGHFVGKWDEVHQNQIIDEIDRNE